MAKRKKIGGIDGSTILVLGVVGVGGYLLYNAIANNASAQNNTQYGFRAASAVNKDISTATAAGAQQILSSSQIADDAISIGQLGQTTDSAAKGGAGADQSSQDEIVSILDTYKSLLDWYLLVQDFGTRQVATSNFSMCATFSIFCTVVDLQTFLAAALDAAHVNEVNANFVSNGLSAIQFVVPTSS
jgi:hypothetical protein